MIARFAIVVAGLLAAVPALAEPMNAETARRFVAGKLFAFNCFDGSRGAGRIYSDGSVIGSVQFQGSGPMKSLWLPAGTLRVKGDTYCANLKGMLFEPCFNLSRLDDRSFRGAVSGMGFAYCDFTRRMSVAGMTRHPQGAEPQAPEPAAVVARGAN
jgi:hypothetical protein